MTREALFLSQLDLIERIVAWVCARRCLRGADAQDFASTVKLRLIEEDYEVLARFEGRSSLKTYLITVVNRLYLDFQRERFGKWRPSAEARRRGPVALRLEALLYRDGLSVDEAGGVMRTEFLVGATREDLYALSLELPRRTGPGPTRGDREEPQVAAEALARIEKEERQARADRTFAELRRALCRLPARDRILLRLHVESGFSIADVARALGEDQKALYRRRDTLLAQLRRDLEAAEIGRPDAQELLSTLDWDAALGEPAEGWLPEDAPPRPSQANGRTDRKEGA